MSRAKVEIDQAFKGLDEHIQQTITPELNLLEGRRKRRYLLSRAICLPLLFLIIPYGLHVLWETTQPDWTWADKIVPNIVFWLFGALGVGMLGSAITRGVKTDAKDSMMSGIADYLGWSFNVSPAKPAVMEYLTEVKMHNPLSIEEYEDEIAGQILRHNFTLTEANLSGGQGHGRGKNRHSFDFEGVILSIDFPKRVFGTTILRRIANHLEWRNIKVLKKVGFADPEFNETYQVFGNDPVEVYYLFSPDIMVTLMDTANDLGGKLAACVFWEGKLNLMIETKNKFEVKTTAEAFANDKQFIRVKKDIKSIYKMIEKVEYYLTHRDPKDFR